MPVELNRRNFIFKFVPLTVAGISGVIYAIHGPGEEEFEESFFGHPELKALYLQQLAAMEQLTNSPVGYMVMGRDQYYPSGDKTQFEYFLQKNRGKKLKQFCIQDMQETACNFRRPKDLILDLWLDSLRKDTQNIKTNIGTALMLPLGEEYTAKLLGPAKPFITSVLLRGAPLNEAEMEVKFAVHSGHDTNISGDDTRYFAQLFIDVYANDETTPQQTYLPLTLYDNLEQGYKDNISRIEYETIAGLSEDFIVFGE